MLRPFHAVLIAVLAAFLSAGWMSSYGGNDIDSLRWGLGILIALVVFSLLSRFFELRRQQRVDDALEQRLNKIRLLQEKQAVHLSRLTGLVGVAVENIGDDEGRSPEKVEARMLEALVEKLDPSSRQAKLAGDAGPMPDAAEAAALDDGGVLDLVKNALRHDRIDVMVQPVVSLPQRRVRYYEVFSRIRLEDDSLLSPDRYLAVAKRGDVLAGIDNILLMRCMQLIRDGDRDGGNFGFFCNISALTLKDADFMGELAQFLRHNQRLAPKLVFELGYSDLVDMAAGTISVLHALAHLGCRFSVDNVQGLDLEFRLLVARNIRFVKVDAPILVTQLGLWNGMQNLRNFKRELDRRSIDLVLSRCETEKQLQSLYDINMDYGQGFLFGAPQPSSSLLLQK